jgi:type II secretory pathway component PulK
MKLPRHARSAGGPRRGAALILSLLLLFVLVAITLQIGVTTGTDARVARNDLTMTSMDLAIESAILQVQETLKTDGEASGESGQGQPQQGAAQGAQPQDPAAGAAAGTGPTDGEAGASDTRKDEWATPQRTEINEVRLRILVVDEDSKYNVLNLANPDEKEAEAAQARIARILDLCREGTEADIDTAVADQMARAMREFIVQRDDMDVPRAKLLADDPQREELALPRSMLDFAVLEPFEPMHFRDFRDINGEPVHSIASFLTVWTSVSTAGEALGVPAAGEPGSTQGSRDSSTQAGTQGVGGASATGQGGSGQAGTGQGGTGQAGTGQAGAAQGGTGQGANAQGQAGQGAAGQSGDAQGAGASNTNGTANGGYGVNVNTAPPAVLKALFDGREVDPRFLDEIIEYRNLEEEEEQESAATSDEEEAEEALRYDEWGNEVVDLRAFEELAELQQVPGYDRLDRAAQDALARLLSVQSNVFSVYVVARRATSIDGDVDAGLDPAEARRLEEQGGDSLVRVVRAVLWRRQTEEGTQIVPLVRWEVLDYLPIEVLDYPDEDR